jgi:MoxR-like ATPase
MNPFDNVGTARISDSVYDRWCRLAVGYQDAAEEADIVAGPHGRGRRAADRGRRGAHPRHAGHPELRRGSSVRGAIDLHRDRAGAGEARVLPDHERVVLDAALLALSARIGVDEASELTPEG